jgi:hypothetical protein
MSADREKDYFAYLDRLQKSAVTNMFGAGPYLQKVFGLTRHEAKDVLQKWMQSKDQPKE